MKSEILRKANLEFRKSRPYFSNEKICDTFRSNNLIEIGFLSNRCQNDCSGSCIMCDYGVAKGTHSIQEYICEMDQILNGLDESVDTLLLCTNGSFLDHRQIRPELFLEILKRASQSNVQNVEVETHYQDITAEKLQLMKQMLPGKRILIEMGLETISPKYQSHFIMKRIDLTAYEKTIALIQDFGFLVETNIMIGFPFLSEAEQFEDAISTINWAFSHQCNPVLFPINIKPYTLLMDMYKQGYYHPISHWLVLLILDTLTEKQLEKTTVAWYGNREEVYDGEGERAVFPVFCPACADIISNFYPQFLATSGGHERRRLLDQLFTQAHCDCLMQTKSNLAISQAERFETLYSSYADSLVRRNIILKE